MTADPAAGLGHTIIESLGVYFPPREISTDDVVRGCRKKIRFPLERMTGIKSRHAAGETEFAIDLAKQAITRCLAISRHVPADVDVVISVAIGRVDGPDMAVCYEPSTALRLKKHFGFHRAMAFDVSSACSGMWAGVNIVDAMIQRGVIERGLVVSGEYITHLAATAQLEIEDLLDSRLACLTVGDSGAAVLLEAAPANGAGFAALNLCTFGGYSEYCTAGPTEQTHGGFIMFTDALRLTEAAARHGSDHALATMAATAWSTDSFEHLIMHQTSRTALAGATRAINRRMKSQACHAGNTIDILARRGNTATTSHFVALADSISSGRIRSGDRIIFAISGSGLTVGTALYTLDDLPDRVTGVVKAMSAGARPSTDAALPARARPRIRITSIGTAAAVGLAERRDSMALLQGAARDCLDQTSRHRNEIGLLIYAGTYRTGFIKEPAIAALLAGALDVNATATSHDGSGTLAFDVLNGAVGLLNACYVAVQMIGAKKAKAAMVVAAETENNAEHFPDDVLGIAEAGSALLLDEASGRDDGFGAFLFRSFPEYIDMFVSSQTTRDGRAFLQFTRHPDLERQYVRAIATTVTEFLHREQIELVRVAHIFPPQISGAFITELSAAMAVPRERFVDAVHGGRDLFTSSLPMALRQAHERGIVRDGDLGLIITVGAGIQVGCALYHF